MKKTLLTLTFVALATTSVHAEVIEAIVARVGDRIVTRTQFAARLSEGYADIDRTPEKGSVPQRKADLRKNLLENIVGEMLIKDRADRLGITVAPDEVVEAVARLKREYNLRTDEEFAASLASSGLTRTEMESRLRESLLSQKVFARELRARTELSDRELRERYDRERESFRRPERAQVREIVIAADTPQALAEASASAVQIAARAKQGEDFAKLATEFSDAPTKTSGGLLGEVAKGELLDALDSAVFSTDAGAVVGPVQTRAGFHIMKIEQRLASEVPSFDSVKEQLRKDSSDDAFQRDYKAYIERLRKEAFIQVNEDNIPQA